MSDRQGIRDWPFVVLFKILAHTPCSPHREERKSGDNDLKLLGSAWAFQRHAPFFFLMQGRRKARYMDFRAHLTQSSVMTIGFGTPVGAHRRRSSARVLITVSKLRATSPLQYSTSATSAPLGSPHICMHAAFSLIPPGNDLLSQRIWDVLLLWVTIMIRLRKAEQGADALMVPSPTRNGKRTYLLLVYLEYSPVYYAAFAWLATVIANGRTHNVPVLTILQRKKRLIVRL